MTTFIQSIDPELAQTEGDVARLAVNHLTDDGARAFTNFEVNVAYNKSHFFATAKRSITDSTKAIAVLTSILIRFPAFEGFTVSLSGSTKGGRHININ